MLESKVQLFVMVCAIVNSLMHERGTAFHIEITQDAPSLNSKVNISCSYDESSGPILKPIFMEMKKDDGKPIAMMRHPTKISPMDNMPSNYQVEGHLEEDNLQNYIRLAITNPTVSDIGDYTCLLLGTDVLGNINQYKATRSLTANNLNIISIVNYLMTTVTEQKKIVSSLKDTLAGQNTLFQNRFNNQTNTIIQLKDQLEDQDTKFQNRLDNQLDRITQLKDQNVKLQNRLNSQNQQIKKYSSEASAMKMRDQELQTLIVNQSVILDGLTERDKFMTAFSAGYSGNSFKTGDVVLFNKMHFQVGDGYNTNTGIYKAPRAGYYIFSLIVLYYNSGNDLRINIVANDKPVAETYIARGTYYRQSSVSAVVKLEVGDVVKPVVKSAAGTRSLYGGYPFTSEFIGYILKAL